MIQQADWEADKARLRAMPLDTLAKVIEAREEDRLRAKEEAEDAGQRQRLAADIAFDRWQDEAGDGAMVLGAFVYFRQDGRIVKKVHVRADD